MDAINPFLGAGIGFSAQEPGNQLPPIAGHATLRFDAPSSASLGEPIILKVTLSNRGKDDIAVDFGGNSTTGFRLTQTRPDGTVQVLRPGLPIPRGASVLVFMGNYTVAPKQSHTEYLVLDEWLRFNQEGKHTLIAEFLGPLKDKSGRALVIDRKAEFSITVGPRDPGRLRALSQQGLQTLLHAKSAVEEIAACTALSHVDDPVAVPSLESAAASDQCYGAFVTLGRIGNDEAIAALHRLATNPKSGLGAIAKSVLASVGKRP